MPRGEEISYRFVRDRAHASGNAKATRALEKIGPPPYANGDVFIQRRWLSAYHGDLHTMNMVDFLSIMLDATEYTLGDVARFIRTAPRATAIHRRRISVRPPLQRGAGVNTVVPVRSRIASRDRDADPAR